MGTRTTAKVIGLSTLLLAGIGCEREVVGETYEGQLHGDRSLEVTFDSPARATTSDDDAPTARPSYEWSPSIRDANDPAVRGMLLASGARFPEPPGARRVFVPPVAPQPVAVPAEPVAPPPVAPAAPPVIEAPAHPVHAVLAPRPVVRAVVAHPADAPVAP